MLKAILGVSITIGASYAIGYRFGENEKKSLEILFSLKKLLTILAGEIRYSWTPLVEAFSILGEYEDEYWAGFFAKVSEQLADNVSCRYEQSFTDDSNTVPSRTELGEVLRSELEGSPLIHLMKQEDIHEFIRFGKELVCFDKEAQLRRIELYIERIEKRIEYIEKSINERVRLYRILGAAGGIFITILVI